MFAAALTAALSAVQIPLEVPLPHELEAATIEVVVQTTGNHFLAENRSTDHQLLLFGSDEQGILLSLRLAPGQQVLYPFSRESIDGLLLEVVSLGEPAWRNTGALSIDTVRDSALGTLWIQGDGARSIAWSQGPSGPGVVPPASELLPLRFLNAHPGLTDHGAPPSAHVPVPMPADRKGGKPPVLDKKPLPPV